MSYDDSRLIMANPCKKYRYRCIGNPNCIQFCTDYAPLNYDGRHRQRNLCLSD